MANLRDFSKLLSKSTDNLRTLYVAIDGLDECEKSEREELLKELSWLCQETPKMKLFLTGRENLTPELKQAFPTLAHVSMGCVDAQSEISVIIERKIQELLENDDLIVEDPTLVEEISDALAKGAEGM